MRLLLTECGILPRHTVLIGLSGGADSVVLLHALCRAKAEGKIGALCAAHLHHGLRGASADADEAFCRAYCESLGVPFHAERADVAAVAEARGLSVETAAREVRYDYLRRAAALCGADCIAVAHHMDDQAETVLMHLLRGSGLAGLVGMCPRSGDIVRPLLTVRRSEIEAYAAENGLSYCTDETNASVEMLRNRVRHTLLPMMAKSNPRIVERLCAMAELLSTDEAYLRETAEAAARDARTPDGGLDADVLFTLHPAIRSRVLKAEVLRAQDGDVERRDIERVEALLSKQSGTRIELRGGRYAWMDGRTLFVGTPEAQPIYSCPFVAPGTTVLPTGSMTAVRSEFRMPAHAFEAYIDLDALPRDALVRTRQDGDRFHPLGAPGLRKLSDVMTDRKLSKRARVLPLLCSGAEVLWMPGYTIAEQLRVTAHTKRVLHIRFEEDMRE